MSTVVVKHLHRLGVAAGLTFILLVKQNLVDANLSPTIPLGEPLKNSIYTYLLP
jgi:hypothetical protein